MEEKIDGLRSRFYKLSNTIILTLSCKLVKIGTFAVACALVWGSVCDCPQFTRNKLIRQSSIQKCAFFELLVFVFCFLGGYLWIPSFFPLARPSIRVRTNSCLLYTIINPTALHLKFCLLVIESTVLVKLLSHRKLLSINANSIYKQFVRFSEMAAQRHPKTVLGFLKIHFVALIPCAVIYNHKVHGAGNID